MNRIDLKSNAKVWVKFLKSHLMPTIHATIVSHDKLILVYAIVKGLIIDVGKVIEKEIRECALKKQKITALFFPSLIIGICEASGARFEAKNKRSNSKASYYRNSRAPCSVKAEQALELDEMIEALNEAQQAYVRDQMEENQRFWTYLHYLKAQKYQFALYMKSKDANFPYLLLQQFNFGQAEAAAAAVGSENATIGNEREIQYKEEYNQSKKK